MKKAKVFFHPIEDSGTLTISWTSGPKGDAIEAKKGSGVGFFSDSGELLCVIFDEVQNLLDQQFLEFDRHRVEISVKDGKITYSVNDMHSKPSFPKKRVKRKPSKNSKSRYQYRATSGFRSRSIQQTE